MDINNLFEKAEEEGLGVEPIYDDDFSRYLEGIYLSDENGMAYLSLNREVLRLQNVEGSIRKNIMPFVGRMFSTYEYMPGGMLK